MEIALLHQLFFEATLGTTAEEEAVGHDDTGSAVGLEHLDNEVDEEIGRLLGLEGFGEVLLGAVLLTATKGRIGHDAIYALIIGDVYGGASERISADDIDGRVYAVEEHVGDGEDMREGLGLPAGDGALIGLDVGLALGGLLETLKGADEKAARATGRIEHRFAKLGGNGLDDEVGDRTGRVVLARRAGILELAEELLVDVVHGMAIGALGEVELVHTVDHLAQEHALAHVVTRF